MRSRTDIEAELCTLEPPRPAWGTIGDVAASLERSRQWRMDNPEKARRREELLVELDAVDRHEAEMASFAAVVRRARSAGVGERSREVAEKAADTPALTATRLWLATGRTWLLLAGDVGTGKSVAGVWALLEVAKSGQTVAFRRAAEVARLSGFDAGAEELARLKRVGLLVLDDLGTECATGWGQSILHELLDTRHESKLRTIVTGNLKRNEARARLGDRLADRVQQDGRVVWLEGKSLRGAA